MWREDARTDPGKWLLWVAADDMETISLVLPLGEDRPPFGAAVTRLRNQRDAEKGRADAAEGRVTGLLDEWSRFDKEIDPLLAFVNSVLPHPVAGPARVDFVAALHRMTALIRNTSASEELVRKPWSPSDSWVERALQGKVEDIDDAIDTWHKTKPMRTSVVPLSEWLGLTEAEYARFVSDPSQAKEILAEKWKASKV
jgi:hypothetical protein